MKVLPILLLLLLALAVEDFLDILDSALVQLFLAVPRAKRVKKIEKERAVRKTENRMEEKQLR